MTSHSGSLCRFARVRSISTWIWIGVVAIGPFALVTPCALASERAPIDVMFVIDNSGSMRKNDPAFITPRVVRTSIGRLSAETRAGMILFDQTARLAAPLVLISSDLAQQQFNSGIAQIDYKGLYTNSATGIERALYELRSKGRPNAQKGIIFITDGIQDTGDVNKDRELNQWLKEDLTAESRAMGVRIFGIAFTNEADYALIQSLASRTGGGYYRAYDASEISGVLEDILNRLAPPPAPVQTVAVAPIEPLPQLPPPPASTLLPSEPFQETRHALMVRSGTYISIALLLIAAAALAAFVRIRLVRKKVVGAKAAAIPVVKPRPTVPEAFLEELAMALGKDPKNIPINKEHMTIGRNAQSDIHIDHRTISGFHATLECKNAVFYLEDQRSTNGTRLNDRRLPPNQPVRLKGGDRIAFATIGYRFVMPDQLPFGETIMISMTPMQGPDPGSTVILDLDSLEGKPGLISCMQNHLQQVRGMGARYTQFAKVYFDDYTLEIVASKAHAFLKKTAADGGHHCGSFTRQNALFVVCSLPVSIVNAPDFYGKEYGGFLQLIKDWIKSEAYRNSGSERLCLVSFGQNPSTWVSLTIVPTHPEPEPVEIMSVDFLSDAEKAILALDFDHNGRVI